jgi:hypothetical protein
MRKPAAESGWHKCGAPPCQRRVNEFHFCCGQHRSLLGWQLSADLQTAWRERQWRRDHFEHTRRRALKAWGWREGQVPDLTKSDMDRVIGEYELAKKALKWMVEHKVYWDWRTHTLVQPLSMKAQVPEAQPSIEILAFIHGVAREIDLEAEVAG